MARSVALALAVILQAGDALRACGPIVTRRSAVAGLLAGLPGAACAAVSNPLNFESEVTFKTRSYDSPQIDTRPAAKAGCPEGTRKTPDGFGGFTCKEKVKSVANRVLGDGDASPPPPPPPKKAAAPVGMSTRSSSSESTGALTVEQLIENSITQKETLLGRKLSDEEKAAMAAKVKALMGS